ncbi:hypothetical protein GCK72_006791 [Caenorhabditis remanei]|uniref:Uncharacterized protein n=1 Tax=Caenorhabditis remanei TaxID=31234 RepID=A0A6A5HKB3_CAERE|nr:hypothetical protein GCK72_006791 [Caenorhabditis remanei]KAF1766833.1 hypothetical protein GCK72_006791 [Caenorhabditis remanei]
MAFYFALLNVSKKDNTQEKQSSSSHRRHRRHSIASVESPLLDYRLLPRPQLLSDDVVITNDLAHQVESSSSSAQPNRLSDRRSRGSARASKWVQDNHSAQLNNRSHHPPLQRESHQVAPSSSRGHLSRNDTESDPPPLSRSKRMAFGGEKEEGNPSKSEEKVKKRGGRAKIEERKRGERQSEEEEDGKQKQNLRPRGRGKKEIVSGEEESGKETAKEDTGRKMKMKSDGQVGGNKEEFRKKEPVKTMRRGFKSQLPIPVHVPSTTNEQGLSKTQSTTFSKNGREHLHPPSKYTPLAVTTSSSSSALNSNSNSRYFSPPVPNGRKPRQVGTADHPLRSSVFQAMAGSSATDESGRSSSQMSNESITPRRDDSPASSCCDPKEQEVTMKLSAVSMSSRSSEPRLKKVTFESSPYVISNSFLGDGAGKVLVVRRGSGTAVRRVGAMGNGWNQSKVLIEGQPEEVSGDDWWTHCGKDEEEEAIIDNQLNKNLEKGKRIDAGLPNDSFSGSTQV